MKKIIVLLMLALLALPVMAEDQAIVQPAADDVQLGTLHALNNVYAVKDEHKTALCACGKEFEVTAETASMNIHGLTMYACGPECAAKMKYASAEEMIKAIMDWEKSFAAKEMASNCMMQDGKKMATCACGGTFEVGVKTPCVVENGMKLNACCDGCAEHVMKASPEERAGMMKKAMYSSEKK